MICNFMNVIHTIFVILTNNAYHSFEAFRNYILEFFKYLQPSRIFDGLNTHFFGKLSCSHSLFMTSNDSIVYEWYEQKAEF